MHLSTLTCAMLICTRLVALAVMNWVDIPKADAIRRCTFKKEPAIRKPQARATRRQHGAGPCGQANRKRYQNRDSDGRHDPAPYSLGYASSARRRPVTFETCPRWKPPAQLQKAWCVWPADATGHQTKERIHGG